MKLVFMGTPTFSVSCLKALIQNGYEVVAAYSQPPRPSGRGHHVIKSPVHEAAEAAGIPVFTPKSLRTQDEQDIFAEHQVDLAVVVAYGLILPKEILSAPHKGCINVHASVLPRWRGAAPIQRAIEAGDHETGITIMQMEEGLDTGPMIHVKKIVITGETTGQTLHDQLMVLGAEALIEVLPSYMNGAINPLPQPVEGVTYASKLAKDEGQLDWMQPADLLERKIRALYPWPGTSFIHEGTRLKIHKACVDNLTLTETPGLIVSSDGLVIACGRGSLRILSLQRPGGTPLSAQDFLRGYALPTGTILPCPVTN